MPESHSTTFNDLHPSLLPFKSLSLHLSPDPLLIYLYSLYFDYFFSNHVFLSSSVSYSLTSLSILPPSVILSFPLSLSPLYVPLSAFFFPIYFLSLLLSLSLILSCKTHPDFPRGLILLETFQGKRINCRSGMIFGESSLTLD